MYGLKRLSDWHKKEKVSILRRGVEGQAGYLEVTIRSDEAPEQVEKLTELLLSGLITVTEPAPPEPLWPEGMAEWKEYEEAGVSVALQDDAEETHIEFYTYGTGCPSPTQAHRLACWTRLAAKMDDRVANLRAVRLSGERGVHLTNAVGEVLSVYARFLADVAKGAER